MMRNTVYILRNSSAICKKNFTAYHALVLFILFCFLQSGQAQGHGIVMRDQTICKGTWVALSALYQNVPDHIEVITWSSGGSPVFGSVSPEMTTTYTLRLKDKNNHQEFTETATVYVDLPPSFSIQIKDSVCPGENIILSVSNPLNTGTIHWYASDGNTYPNQSSFSPTQDISFTVRAVSNNRCADIFEKHHRIRLVRTPSSDSLYLKNWEIANICEDCMYNLPTEQDIITNADEINIRSFSWNSVPAGPPYQINLQAYSSTPMLTYTAKVTATLTFKSICGNVSKVFTDYPIQQKIQLKRCSPKLRLVSPPPICFCSEAVFSIYPGDASKCTFDRSDISWNTQPAGTNVQFQNIHNKEIFYTATPSSKTNLTALVQFKAECQSLTDIQNISKSIDIILDPDKCPPSVTYENCPGGEANLIFTTNSPSKLIQSVSILAAHQNLFELKSSSPSKYEFKTKTAISPAQDEFYKRVLYSIVYQLTNCSPSLAFQKDSTVSLVRKTDCRPTLSINYPPYPAAGQTSVCYGDTAFLYLNKTSNSFVLDSVIYSFEKAASSGILNKSNISSTTNRMEHYLFTYVDTNTLYAHVFYKDNGLPSEYFDTLDFYGRNCPCTLSLYEDSKPCSGTDNSFRLNISNHGGSLAAPILWETMPPTTVDSISSLYDKKTGSRFILYNANPIQKTCYKAFLTYKEGDSIRNICFDNLCSKTQVCPPVIELSKPVLCENETLYISLFADNPKDSIIKVEWIGSTKNPIKFIESSLVNNKIHFYYELKVSYADRLLARINTLNNKHILEYIDSADVFIHPYPRAFIKDTVFACVNTNFDLADYENSQAIQTITYSGTLNNSSVINQSEKSKSYQVVCRSNYLCDYMNGNPSFTDRIYVISETTPWVSSKPPEKACSGQAHALSVNANPDSYCTWVILPEDTVAKAIKQGDFVYDTLNSNTQYEVSIHNACPNSVRTSVQVDVFKSPEIRGLDTLTACVGDSLLLLASVSGDMSGEIINPEWSYTNEIYPLWTPRIFVPDTNPKTYKFRCSSRYSGDFSCMASKNFIVKGNPKPNIVLSLSLPLIDGNVICAHANELIDVSVSGAYSYKWQDSSTFSMFPSKVSADTNTVFILVGSDKNACSATASFFYKIKNVDYNPKDTMVCRSEKINFKAENTGNTFYAWSFNGQNISNTISLDIPSVQASDTGKYTLFTQRDGCRDTHHIQLSMRPSPYVRFPSLFLRFCEGSEAILKPDSLVVDRFFLIKPDDVVVPSDTVIAYRLEFGHEGYYRFVGKLESCTDTTTLHLKVDTLSLAEFVFDDTKTYCSGTDLNLLSIATPLHDSNLYIWKTAVREDSTQSPSFTIKNLRKADQGLLTLVVKKHSCTDSISKDLKIQNAPEPVLYLHDKYCQGDTAEIRVRNIAPHSTHEWKYKGNFISSDSVLRLENIQKNQEGAYYYINTEALCSSEEKQANLRIDLPPFIQLDDSVLLCTGDTLILSSELSGADYRWQDGSTSPAFVVRKGGMYCLEVILDHCSSKDSTWVIERLKPLFSLGRDTTVCNGEIVWLQGPQGMDAYLWQEKSGEENFEVKEEGFYVLEVLKEACRFSDSVHVFYKFCGRFYVAGAFTPNNDGLNDAFGVITNAKDHEVVFQMSIFERSGKLVFQTKSLEQLWDGTYKGKPCPAGTYVYVIKASDIKSGSDLSSTGTVNLIR